MEKNIKINALTKFLNPSSTIDSPYKETYNTTLNDEQEKQFQDWVKLQSILKNRDISKDLNDYDLRGFYLNNQVFSGNGHGSDMFKKPNHPTFSDQSQYNGVDGNIGGHWSEDNNNIKFKPSQTNLENNNIEFLKRYFKLVEPGVKLEE